MEILLIIINLVLLVCFFMLVSNVAAIKQLLMGNKVESWKQSYEKADLFGRADEAKRALEELIYDDVKRINNTYSKPDKRKDEYEHLKSTKYKGPLERGLIVFPDFDKLIKL